VIPPGVSDFDSGRFDSGRFLPRLTSQHQPIEGNVAPERKQARFRSFANCVQHYPRLCRVLRNTVNVLQLTKQRRWREMTMNYRRLCFGQVKCKVQNKHYLQRIQPGCRHTKQAAIQTRRCHASFARTSLIHAIANERKFANLFIKLTTKSGTTNHIGRVTPPQMHPIMEFM